MNAVGLRGDRVEKRYGRVAALRGIDFAIQPGEAVAILGSNGAGKSSLLRILAGLSRPSAGSFAGQRSGVANSTGLDLTRSELRAAVGYVGHATLIYGELSARENLLFAARLHGHRPDRGQLDRVLADFDLLDVAERRAGTFSRGMAQRLSIARAVIHEPGLLLLDEPFTGLDELSATRLSDRLAEQRRTGRTLIVVTHDPKRAVELTDRALVLHHGEIRATPAREEAAADAFSTDGLRDLLTRLARESDRPVGTGASRPTAGGAAQ